MDRVAAAHEHLGRQRQPGGNGGRGVMQLPSPPTTTDRTFAAHSEPVKTNGTHPPNLSKWRETFLVASISILPATP